jgi:hypothetical protein
MPLAAQGVDHFGKPSTLCIACRHGTRHQRTKRISHGTSTTRQRPRAAFRSTLRFSGGPCSGPSAAAGCTPRMAIR